MFIKGQSTHRILFASLITRHLAPLEPASLLCKKDFQETFKNDTCNTVDSVTTRWRRVGDVALPAESPPSRCKPVTLAPSCRRRRDSPESSGRGDEKDGSDDRRRRDRREEPGSRRFPGEEVRAPCPPLADLPQRDILEKSVGTGATEESARIKHRRAGGDRSLQVTALPRGPIAHAAGAVPLRPEDGRLTVTEEPAVATGGARLSKKGTGQNRTGGPP